MPINSPEKKLFLIDAFAIIFRSYFAFGSNQRYNSEGINTSVTLGFANTLLEILNKQKPSHIAVVFDMPGKTFRNDMYPEYKAHRNETPEDIIASIPYVKQLIDGFNIPMLGEVGFEADDVIGTVSKMAEKEGFQTFMMTPDKDFAQLVSDNIFMYKPARSGNPAEVWGIPEVQEKFQITHPEQVIDILGLWGDAADNIPGIPGIGEKTSKKLIAKYGSIEELLKNTDDLKGKQKENVITFGEQGLLSKRLATIDLNVPVDVDFDAMLIDNWDEEKLLAIFSEMEFRFLAQRVLGVDIVKVDKTKTAVVAPRVNDEDKVSKPKISAKKSPSNGQMDLFGGGVIEKEDDDFSEDEIKTIEDAKPTYKLIDGNYDITAFIAKLANQKSFCFDTETTGLDTQVAEIIGMSFCWKSGEGYYVNIPVGKEQEIMNAFKDVFKDENTEKIAQNLKYDINILKRYGVEVKGAVFDTMIAHYLLEPDLKHGMDFLAETYLNYRPISIESLIGKKGKNQLSMRDVDLKKLTDYAVEDADITWQLKALFNKRLETKKVKDLFYDIEMPLVSVLSTMENNGISLNSETLNEFSKELEIDIAALEKSVIEQAGKDFNVGSPKQLGEVLFDELKIDEKAKKTKSGQYSTSEETLTKLAGKHPIIEDILSFRQLKKLKSTYVDALPVLVNERTNKIHTTYNQTVAATGRLASVNPNLQNIPIKTEKGREVRKAFVPSEGNSLYAADYSQVELRLMAAMSEDENMVAAFQSNQDIHSATAAKVFGVSIEEVTREMRGKAKMVNFGIIYGISAFGLSQRLNIKRKEAKGLIDEYFKNYPGVKRFMEDSVDNAKEVGYVQTIMKRKRFLKDINSSNAIVRGYAERNAINAPIQGSAADVIKIAMINIHTAMKEQGLKSKMLLQVHDELVFDVVPEEKEIIAALVKDKMENAIKTIVPLTIEGSFGETWLEAH
jgi:DNA polymerase-1